MNDFISKIGLMQAIEYDKCLSGLGDVYIPLKKLEAACKKAMVNDDDIPQIKDMVPVIHAYWKPLKPYSTEYQCSYCGDLWNDIKTPYCHECGAKMDAKSEDLT